MGAAQSSDASKQKPVEVTSVTPATSVTSHSQPTTDALVITENDIRNIAEGAGERQALANSYNGFLQSNARHKAVDVALALASYTFGGCMHVYGQGAALTSLSMWAAGTTFLLNLQLRKVLSIEDVEKRKQVTEDMGIHEKNVFQLEMVASWVWMLSSMQQFKQYKRLKYCGYSSWMGLSCCMYFTLRHMYSVLVLE